MILARLRSPTSRTSLNLKMMLAKLPLLTLTTLQSLRMMVARPTLLLLVPDVMLKPQPEMERTRLWAKESARRFQTVKEPFQTHKQELMDRMSWNRRRYSSLFYYCYNDYCGAYWY